jgi:hypothetical protein
MQVAPTGWLESRFAQLSDVSERPLPHRSLYRARPIADHYSRAVSYARFGSEAENPQSEHSESALPPKADVRADVASCRLWAKSRHGACHLLFVSGLAISRAPLMKSCAAGVSARVFNVKTPIGPLVFGKVTRNSLIDGCWPGNLSIDRGRKVR